MFCVHAVVGLALLLRDLLCGLRRHCDSDLLLSLLHFVLIQWHLAQYFDVHVLAFVDYILSGYLQYEWWAMTYPELRWTLLMGLRHPDVAWSTLMGGGGLLFAGFHLCLPLFNFRPIPTWTSDSNQKATSIYPFVFFGFDIHVPCKHIDLDVLYNLDIM